MEHKDITAFIHHHIKPEIREADYDSLPSLADILDTFTNMTYKAVYVIDYNKGIFHTYPTVPCSYAEKHAGQYSKPD